MKKLFTITKRIIVGFILTLLVLIAGLFFFKNEIKDLCLKNLSLVLNTHVDIGNAEIQFIQSFPKVSLHLTELKIQESFPESTDSLLVMESINLGFDIKELFKGNFVINRCILSNGYLHLKIDSLGNNNFSIFKETKDKKESSPFSLKIDALELYNVEVQYLDKKIKNNHIFWVKEAKSSLAYNDKQTEIELDGDFICKQIGVNKSTFLEKKPFKLKTDFVYDTELQKVILKDTELTLEKALFKIDGSFSNQKDMYWDLIMSSPNADIQSLISLLPHEISKDLLEYQSSGNLYFSGKIQGIQNEKQSPLIEFDFGFKNTSLYHPKVDQKITEAQLEGKFTNGKKHNSSTSVLTLKNISAYIGKDLIRGNILISNFDDPYLDVDLKGNFDVESALKLYPIKKIKSANGKIEADVNFKGKLSHLTDVSKTQYIKTSGKFVVKNLNFHLDSVGVDFRNFNGMFYFDKHDLGISKLGGQVGRSDFEIKGIFKNFIAFVLLDNEILKVQAEFNSDFIDANEILSKAMNQSDEKTAKKDDKNYSFHLSPYLAYDLNCHIKKLEFRNLTGNFAGKNLSGKLLLRDQLLHYQNLSLEVANGAIKMNGVVNAKDTSDIIIRNSTKIEHINVKQAFFVLENFGQVFITDKNLEGTLSANVESILHFDSHLRLNFDNLSSMAEIKIVNGALVKFEPMQEMGSFLRKKAYSKYMKSTNFDNIKFSELKNTIYINRGLIEIPEMVVQSDLASDLTISGTHSFNNKINYKVSFPLVNYNREERLQDSGISMDKKNRWNLYLSIKGDVDNYKIDIDENKSIKSAVGAAGVRVQELMKEEQPKAIPLDHEMEMMIMEEF